MTDNTDLCMVAAIANAIDLKNCAQTGRCLFAVSFC